MSLLVATVDFLFLMINTSPSTANTISSVASTPPDASSPAFVEYLNGAGVLEGVEELTPFCGPGEYRVTSRDGSNLVRDSLL